MDSIRNTPEWPHESEFPKNLEDARPSGNLTIVYLTGRRLFFGGLQGGPSVGFFVTQFTLLGGDCFNVSTNDPKLHYGLDVALHNAIAEILT
jgi:hypothetical protein